MSNTTSLGELERWSGGFPGAHEFSNLDGLDPKLGEHVCAIKEAGVRLVNMWAGGQFVGLYLYGTPGIGKTHGAIGIARALHDVGARVTYVNAQNISPGDSTSPADWSNPLLSPEIKTTSYNMSFPRGHNVGIERNNRSVLVLDEYTPDRFRPMAAATGAAAEYGGLIIITSNYTNPFGLVDPVEAAPSDSEILLRGAARRVDPAAIEEADAKRARRLGAIRESMTSRVTTGFKLIECTGVDQRPTQDSFWD